MQLRQKFSKFLEALRSPSVDVREVSGVPGEDPTFVRLVQLVNTDEDFRAMIMKVIALDSFNRSSMVNSIIDQQRLRGASPEHLQVLKYLTDDTVCQKIKALINNRAR